MLIENVTPFVRFAAKQTLRSQKNIVGYDNRVYFGLSGQATITVDGVDYPMKSNTLLIWRAGQTYTYREEEDSAGFEIASCNFDYTRASQHVTVPVPPAPQRFFDAEKILSEPCVFEDNKHFNGVIYVENAAILRSLMLSLCEEFIKTTKYHRLKLNALMQEILWQTARLVDNEVLPQVTELAESVTSYLRKEYLNNPTLKDISEHFSYHPNYLNNVVLNHTGMPIHQYLINLKLNKALELLMYTNLSVNDVSKQLNILDPRYFARMFKKHFKKSPSDFRKNK